MSEAVNNVIDKLLENRELEDKKRFYNLVQFLLMTMKDTRKGIAKLSMMNGYNEVLPLNIMHSLILLMEIEFGDFDKFLKDELSITDEESDEIKNSIKDIFAKSYTVEDDGSDVSPNITQPFNFQKMGYLHTTIPPPPHPITVPIDHHVPPLFTNGPTMPTFVDHHVPPPFTNGSTMPNFKYPAFKQDDDACTCCFDKPKQHPFLMTPSDFIPDHKFYPQETQAWSGVNTKDGTPHVKKKNGIKKKVHKDLIDESDTEDDDEYLQDKEMKVEI